MPYAVHDDPPTDKQSSTFLCVPVAWLEDFGRITILSGRIELAAYEIGGALGLERPSNGRTISFRRECKAIAAQLRAPDRAQVAADWQDGAWRESVLAWVAEAQDVMDKTRNAVMHQNYFWLKHEGAWGPGFVRDRRDRSTGVPLTVDMLESAVRDLVPIDRRGMKLWHDMPGSPFTN